MDASDWQVVAAEVTVALEEVGFTVTLEQAGAATGDPWNPTPGEPTEHVLTALQDLHQVRDASGTLVGQTVRTLTLATGVAEPHKSDRIEVPAGSGSWHEVGDVRPFAPGGVVLYWEVDLVGG